MVGRHANKEMNDLIRLLSQSAIPFEVIGYDYDPGTIQICCPTVECPRCDAVSHRGTYGHTQGLIETMSDMRPDVDGWLTAAEAFEIFKEVWNDELGVKNHNDKF